MSPRPSSTNYVPTVGLTPYPLILSEETSSVRQFGLRFPLRRVYTLPQPYPLVVHVFGTPVSHSLPVPLVSGPSPSLLRPLLPRDTWGHYFRTPKQNFRCPFVTPDRTPDVHLPLTSHLGSSPTPPGVVHRRPKVRHLRSSLQEPRPTSTPLPVARASS